MKISVSNCFSPPASKHTEAKQPICLLILKPLLLLILVSVAKCDTTNAASKSTLTTGHRRDSADWSTLVGGPIDWQPVDWKQPYGGHASKWRRVSVDDDDHERQVLLLPTSTSNNFNKLATRQDDYARFEKQMDDKLSGPATPRQIRQVDSSKQLSGNTNIHILSQEHVILDHHTNSRRHSSHHTGASAPRSLMFFQSTARSNGEGKYHVCRATQTLLRLQARRKLAFALFAWISF